MLLVVHHALNCSHTILPSTNSLTPAVGSVLFLCLLLSLSHIKIHTSTVVRLFMQRAIYALYVQTLTQHSNLIFLPNFPLYAS